MLGATAACNFSTSDLQKVVQTRQFFKILCFAPQRRAIFADFKNGSEAEVFCTFWLENGLGATAACHFLQIATSKMATGLRCLVHFDLAMCFSWLEDLVTSERPKVARTRQFCSILTYKCAWRQSRVQFFDLTFKKWSEPVSFSRFWLTNVLRATATCHFCRSQL